VRKGNRVGNIQTEGKRVIEKNRKRKNEDLRRNGERPKIPEATR
jgi:hypothetical protein